MSQSWLVFQLCSSHDLKPHLPFMFVVSALLFFDHLTTCILLVCLAGLCFSYILTHLLYCYACSLLDVLNLMCIVRKPSTLYFGVWTIHATVGATYVEVWMWYEENGRSSMSWMVFRILKQLGSVLKSRLDANSWSSHCHLLLLSIIKVCVHDWLIVMAKMIHIWCLVTKCLWSLAHFSVCASDGVSPWHTLCVPYILTSIAKLWEGWRWVWRVERCRGGRKEWG